MRQISLGSVSGSWLVVLLLLVPLAVRAQSINEWAPPRTSDGQPDIQGVWTNFDRTPFEAPSEVDLQRLAPLAKWFPGSNEPQTPPPPVDPNVVREVSGFADGPGSAPRNRLRRSMVVDPPSGRIPVREEAVTVRNNKLINLTDSWMNHTPWERCITRGVPGGIFPPGYGAGYRILQPPGYVVILYEMIHEARVIPIDGPPHINEEIRQWNGDSRGTWEGNTLVVEVANYNDKGAIATNIATRGARGLARSEGLRVVERFTFSDPDIIDYEVAIEDPAVYHAPWKVAMPLNRDTTYDLFEYACHEGNYGLENSLSAGRSEDRSGK